MITGSTLGKQKFFDTEIKRAYLHETLHEKASEMDWALEAWAILHNHYHFVARAPQDVPSLQALIRSIHSLSARFVNGEDNTPGRRIWHNYWDKCISSDKEYLGSLHYVHMNSVKHGLVVRPEDDPFSSCKMFIEEAGIEFQREVLSQSLGTLNIEDNL
jgi:putative transposase